MDFKQFPKSARDFLTKYKDAKISNFVIRKNPIQSGVEKVLNFVSQMNTHLKSRSINLFY